MLITSPSSSGQDACPLGKETLVQIQPGTPNLFVTIAASTSPAPAPYKVEIRKRTYMPNLNNTSLGAVRSSTPAGGRSVRRSTLTVGDLYSVKGGSNTYMHTGRRTAPPSGRTVEISVGGRSMQHEVFKSLGVDDSGSTVIGFQSIIVKGSITPGSDGAAVSWEDKEVTFLGRAAIDLGDLA